MAKITTTKKLIGIITAVWVVVSMVCLYVVYRCAAGEIDLGPMQTFYNSVVAVFVTCALGYGAKSTSENIKKYNDGAGNSVLPPYYSSEGTADETVKKEGNS